mmetsp:Transcript_58240/g.147869  ORF Transcript_58240/g.147869 Transcript_58240/m.147869 type:complete len:233 (-) Transcript_58240:141-839(-)
MCSPFMSKGAACWRPCAWVSRWVKSRRHSGCCSTCWRTSWAAIFSAVRPRSSATMGTAPRWRCWWPPRPRTSRRCSGQGGSRKSPPPWPRAACCLDSWVLWPTGQCSRSGSSFWKATCGTPPTLASPCCAGSWACCGTSRPRWRSSQARPDPRSWFRCCSRAPSRLRWPCPTTGSRRSRLLVRPGCRSCGSCPGTRRRHTSGATRRERSRNRTRRRFSSRWTGPLGCCRIRC